MANGGRRKPTDGFRPGKEPPHLRKQRAKASLGEDATWAQRKMIDAIGDQSPGEVRKMVGRWTTILLTAAVALAAGGLFLYGWSTAAGIAVHFVALLVGVVWLRIRTQRDQIIEMAEWIQRR